MIDLTTHGHVKSRKTTQPKGDADAPVQHLAANMREPGDKTRNSVAAWCALRNTDFGAGVRGRTMSKDAGYDYTRYRKLLAEAVDETKRIELIDMLIKEKARDRLEAQRMSDRVAMTQATVSNILGPLGRRERH